MNLYVRILHLIPCVRNANRQPTLDRAGALPQFLQQADGTQHRQKWFAVLTAADKQHAYAALKKLGLSTAAIL